MQGLQGHCHGVDDTQAAAQAHQVENPPHLRQRADHDDRAVGGDALSVKILKGTDAGQIQIFDVREIDDDWSIPGEAGEVLGELRRGGQINFAVDVEHNGLPNGFVLDMPPRTDRRIHSGKAGTSGHTAA